MNDWKKYTTHNNSSRKTRKRKNNITNKKPIANLFLDTIVSADGVEEF